MAAPLMAREKGVTIEVVGELISRPYIEITLNLMARFGVKVQKRRWSGIRDSGRPVLRQSGYLGM